MGNYNLEIDPYCSDCPEFEVTVKEEDVWEEDFNCRVNHYILRTVTCKHRKRCQNMVNWLKKNKEKETNNGSTEN